MSNETKKPEAPQSQETSPANRRAFMKTMVTGTVAAGLAATVGKAEAAPATAAACGTPEKYPTAAPVSVKILVNKAVPVTLDRLWEVIHGTFEPSGCPNCGLGGWPHDPNGPFPISDISIECAYLSRDIDTMVVLKDAPVLPSSK